MSDTYRRNHPDAVKYTSLQYWLEYGIKMPKGRFIARQARAKRDQALIDKGADGKNAKGRSYYRFDAARVDGSGKLNTYCETGAKRRNNRALKRQASKDTRRYGKQNIKRGLDDV